MFQLTFDMYNKQNKSELTIKKSCDRHKKHQQLVHFARYATAARRWNASEGWTVQMGHSLSSVQRGQQTEMKKINQTFPGNKVFLWDYNKEVAMSERTKTWWQMIRPPPSAWSGGRLSTSILWVNSCKTWVPFLSEVEDWNSPFYYLTGQSCFCRSLGWIVFICFWFSAGQTLSQRDWWKVVFLFSSPLNCSHTDSVWELWMLCEVALRLGKKNKCRPCEMHI